MQICHSLARSLSHPLLYTNIARVKLRKDLFQLPFPSPGRSKDLKSGVGNRHAHKHTPRFTGSPSKLKRCGLFSEYINICLKTKS